MSIGDAAALPSPEQLLRETGALLQGHFLLTSGLHSAGYLQAMRLLERPQIALGVAAAVVDRAAWEPPTAVLAPALGGVVWGFALSQRLPGSRSLFAEREEGKLTLRRGFTLRDGEPVLLAEDVITTGGTTEELHALVKGAGARVVGIAAVVDRSGGRFAPGVPLVAWTTLAIETWRAEECPLCRAGGVPVKPGSRSIKRPDPSP